MAIKKTDELKVGMRNSAKDAERLQGIHDYAVENGAQCEAVKKSIDDVETRTDMLADEPDELVTFGGEVKALGNGKIGGYLVRFSDVKTPDLTGDYFTKETDLRFAPELDVYYNHGMDSTLKKRVIGRAASKIDDVGLWAETQLNLRDEYEKAIYAMAEKGKLGYSSGALSHLVEREPAGKGISFIKTWAIGECSLTPTPAEPRNAVVTLKSLVIPADTALTAADENIQPVPPTKGVDHMEQNEMIEAAVKALFEKQQAEIAAKAEAENKRQAEIKAASDAAYKQAIDDLKAKGQIKTPPAYVKNLGSDSDDGVMAFKSWLATGAENSELIKPADDPNWANTKAAFNVTAGASGAYLVPDPLYQIIQAKRNLASWVRQAPVQSFQTDADHILVPVEDTSATAFVLTAEAGAYDENEPTLAQKDLALLKYTKVVKMSEEFINFQGTNFDAWIAKVFARAEAVTENSIATPILVAGATSSGITSAGATAITQPELSQLVGKLGGGYNITGETGFLMQNATRWYLKGLTGNYFSFVPTPQGGGGKATYGASSDFFGYEAYISDDMPAMTAGLKAVVYGNMNYFGIVEKPGLLIQRNPYLYMANGQVGLFATIYRGFAVLQGEAFYYMTQHA